VLRLEDVHAYYGAIHALRVVSLEIKEGQIVCLIGANGAGKSSTLMAISGILRASAGRILFEGENLVGAPPHAIVRRGISQVPEGRRIFSKLTVLENLEMGAFTRDDPALVRQDIEQAEYLFDFLTHEGPIGPGESAHLKVLYDGTFREDSPPLRVRGDPPSHGGMHPSADTVLATQEHPPRVRHLLS